MAKRGHYGRWTETDLRRAIETFRNGTMGLNECSRVFKIPKSTLTRHVEKGNEDDKAGTKCFGRNPVFSAKIEELLIRHIMLLSDRFFGLTVNDVRRLAFDIAEKYKLPHNFNKSAKMAGKAWYYGFMKRNAHLSLRQPESTAVIKAKGFNRKCVIEFFESLRKIYDDNDLDPSRIFNVDESEFSTFQTKTQRLAAKRGRKFLSSINGGEPEIYTSMVCCISAAGQYVPPMIIFKRKRLSSELSYGAPPCSITAVSDTGHINSDLFITWLKHFIKYSCPNQDKKILLLLDGHTTHSKNLAAISLAREHGIMMLQLPGHTTQRLQPLKVSFFTPMAAYYDQIMAEWLESHPSKGVTQKHVAEFLGEAYGLAATVTNAIHGFELTGIYPLNINIFGENDCSSVAVLQNVDDRHIIALSSHSNEEYFPDVSPSTSGDSSLFNESNQCPVSKFTFTSISEDSDSAGDETELEKKYEQLRAKVGRLRFSIFDH